MDISESLFDVQMDGESETTPTPKPADEPQQPKVSDQYSVDIVPSSESDVVRVSEEQGLDVDFTRDNFEAVNYLNHRENQRKQLEDKPATLELYNDVNESWAADDYDQLGTIESVIRDVKQGWETGSAIDDLGNAGWGQIMGGQSPDYSDNVAPYREQLQSGRTGDLGYLEGVPGSVSETLPIMFGIIPEVVTGGAIGAASGAAAGSVVPGAGTVSGAVTGGLWGLRVGGAVGAGKIEAGVAYDEYIQMQTTDGQPMSYQAASGAALLVGAVNGALEMVAFEKITRTIPGADAFMGKVTTKNMKLLLGHPSFQNAAANFAGKIAGGAAVEGITEAIQELVTIGGGLMAAGIDGGDFESPSWGEAGEVAWQAFRQGSQAGLGLSIPGASVGAYYEARATSNVEANKKAFDILNGTAQELTSGKQHPAKVQKAVERMRELHNATDTVYIETEQLETFFQEAGVTDEVMKVQAPGTYSALVEARATGGTVAVPLGEYMSVIAPSSNSSTLADYVKFDPESFTANELTGFKAQIAEIEVGMEGDDNFLPSAGIFEDISDKLVESGYTPEAAGKMAVLWESVFESFGDRLPITAQDFFDRFTVNIQSEQAQGDDLVTLEQAAYHGTPHLFDEFSLQFMGEGEGAQAYGWGMYFAGNRKIADFYRDQLSEGPILEDVSIGGLPIYEGGQPADYGPDKYGGEAGATLVEDILIDEWKISEAYKNDGAEGVQALLTEKIDERIEYYRDAVENYPADKEWGDEAIGFLEELKGEVGDATINISVDEGNLYEVDLPEDSVLFDYDKPLSEQPMVTELFDENYVDGGVELVGKGKAEGTIVDGVDLSDSGVSLYNALAADMGSDKAASEYLNSLGIPGLAYNDAISRGDEEIKTRNYVIWDENQIHIEGINDSAITKLFQGEGAQGLTDGQKKKARGYISMNPMRDIFTITLTGRANLSTFLHESGHFFLETMNAGASIEGADQSLVDDMNALRSWLGAEEGQPFTRDQHEQFARGFEGYLMEGKAPNSKVAAAFERFSGWLTRIYKSVQTVLASEGVVLSDEIREVMDRMVGVEQGFIQLQGEFPASFATAEEMGVSDEEFANYTGRHHAAVMEGQRRVKAEVMNDIARQKSAAYRQRKKEIMKEVAEDVDNEMVYRVRNFLSGKWGSDNPNLQHIPDYLFGQKLDSEAVKDSLGSVPPKMIYLTERGSAMTPDEIAPLFGYESGVMMLEDIEGTPSRGDAILNRAQEKLDAEFGDLINDGRLEAESLEALHNGKMSSFIESELKAVGEKAARPTTEQKRLAKYVAEKRIRALPILQLNRSRFLQAEKKSARDAAKAIKEGDFVTALKHKTQQLVSFYMYKEAAVAQRKAESIRKSLNAYTKAPRQKAMGKAGAAYLDAVNALLDGVELTKRSGKVLVRRTNLKEFMDSESKKGNEVFIPKELQNTAELKNYRQMTSNELQTLKDTIDHIWSTAKLKNQIKTSQGNRKMAEVSAKLVELMKTNAKGAKNQLDVKEAGKKSIPRWMAASLIKPEFIMKWIDGGLGGFAQDVLFNPMAEAQHAANDMSMKFANTLNGILDRFSTDRMKAPVSVMGESFKRSEALAIALNMGNRGNLDKLLAGRNWDEAKLILDMQKALSAEEWAAVQDIWELVNTLYPEIERVSMDGGMGRPPKVEASKLVLPELGITLEGGYYPIAYDPSHNHTLNHTKDQTDSIFENNLFNSGVSSGFKEGRVDLKRPPPILLSMNVLSNHIGEVIHFVTHYEAVRQVEKVMNDNAFASQFKDSFGNEYYVAMKDWLKEIANKGVPNADTTFISAASRHLRVGMSMVAMGLNFGTAIMQGFGMFTTVDELGVNYTMKGLSVALNPSVYKDVIEMSGEIRHITRNMDREIADSLNKAFMGNKYQKTMDKVKQFSFMHIAYAQRVVNVATFEGARRKALDEGKSNADAIRYADSVVRMTQSGAGQKDLARIQGGQEILKLFTPFYTYFSVLYNRYHDSVRSLGANPASMMSWMKFGQNFLWLTLAPVYVEILMKSKEPEDDDDWWGWFAKQNIEYMLTTIPVMRTLGTAALSDYTPSAVPAFDIFSDLKNARVSLDKVVNRGYDWDDLTISQQRNLVQTVATLGQLPTKTAWRAYEATVDDTVERPVQHILMGSGRN